MGEGQRYGLVSPIFGVLLLVYYTAVFVVTDSWVFGNICAIIVIYQTSGLVLMSENKRRESGPSGEVESLLGKKDQKQLLKEMGSRVSVFRVCLEMSGSCTMSIHFFIFVICSCLFSLLVHLTIRRHLKC